MQKTLSRDWSKRVQAEQKQKSKQPGKVTAKEQKQKPLNQLILKLAAQKSPLFYNGVKVFIFPDLTAEVLTQRREFDEVRRRCRAANLRYGFLHPARFRITVDEETRIFNRPEMVECFLNQKNPDGFSGDLLEWS